MFPTTNSTTSDGKWRKNIYLQFTNRDVRDTGPVSQLIHQLHVVLERCENYRLENIQLAVLHHSSTASSSAAGGSDVDRQLEQKLYKLQEELTCLHRAKGDTAEQLVVVTNLLQERDKEVSTLNNRIADLQSQVLLLKEDSMHKKEQVEHITSLNTLLRDEYTTLNMTYETLHSQYLTLKGENTELVQRWMEYKAKDAERLNEENDKHFKTRQRALEASLREAAEDLKVVVVSDTDCSDVTAQGSIACPYSVLPTVCFCRAETHDADIHTFCVSNHGKLLATGGEDRKLKLWNIRRDGLSSGHTLLGSNAGINSIDFSPDDSLVMAASTDCASRIWSIPDLRIRHTLTGHSAKVMACKFVGDMSKVVTGGHDRTIKIWDLKSKACSRTIFVGSSCNDLDLCRSSPSLVFSGHHNKKLCVHDLRSSGETTSEVLVGDRVTSVNIFNNVHHCLVSCRDNVLRLVDFRAKEVIMELSAAGVQLGCDATRACVSPDDTYVAVGSGDGALHVWTVSTGALASALPVQHGSCVMACSWTPDGQVFLSCERSKQVLMWSAI